jgi:Negative regulator of beta-lactamase expression
MNALDLLDLRWRPSPNHRSRNGHAVKLIVLHSDASHTLSGTIDWISRPESKVSYHYSVGRTGYTYQHVKDDRSAWHAGKSDWRGETDGKGGVNDFSLGVNLSNRQDGTERYPDAQLDAAARLVASLCIDHRIPASAITTHYLCARPIGRKHDPHPGEPTFDFMAFLGRVNDWAGRIHCDLLVGPQTAEEP